MGNLLTVLYGVWHPLLCRVPQHHKVQKFSSGTGSPGWTRKKGRKTVVVVWWWSHSMDQSYSDGDADVDTYLLLGRWK